jgi:hypothetical protein
LSISTRRMRLATSKTGDIRPFHAGSATLIERLNCNTDASHRGCVLGPKECEMSGLRLNDHAKRDLRSSLRGVVSRAPKVYWGGVCCEVGTVPAGVD